MLRALWNKLTGKETAELLARVRQEVAAGRAVLVDVREPGEWDAGHVAGAIPAPLSRIADAKLPQDRPLYLYCGAGIRARMAARTLRERGHDARPLSAGYGKLVRHGFPTA
jgi:rhodanese-related sulfurtransferase